MQYFDGTFIKVRNINFGYTFNDVTLKKIGFTSLRLYTSIQNPFIFSNYRSEHKGIDPETFIDGEQGVESGAITANVAPPVVQYTFGINVKF